MVNLEPDLETYWSGLKNWIARHRAALLCVAGAFLLGLAL